MRVRVDNDQIAFEDDLDDIAQEIASGLNNPTQTGPKRIRAVQKKRNQTLEKAHTELAQALKKNLWMNSKKTTPRKMQT